MFLISRVFQSPSKRDERETGRRETEVVEVVVVVGGEWGGDEQVWRRDKGRNERKERRAEGGQRGSEKPGWLFGAAAGTFF